MSDSLTPNGLGSSNNGGTPPPPPPPIPVQGGSSSWYENIAIVIIALFCCSPLGLVLVWINKKWTTKTKTIVTAVVIAIAILGAIVGAASSGSSSSSSTEPKQTATTVAKDSSAGNSSETTTTTAKSTQAAVACKDTPDSTNLDTKNQSLYPQRLGISKDDHEASVGDCVRIDGMTAYVLDARVLTPRFGDKVIVVNVKIRGRDATKSYNPFDFKLQTAAGNQESITISLDDSINELNSGSLVKGGEVIGDLVFEYQGPGTYYVVWEPSIIKPDKGFWALNVP
jgi:hypothetical protein